MPDAPLLTRFEAADVPATPYAYAVDPSGEIVVAGSRDTLLVYVWNLQTAQLLDCLSGHEAPISCLAFGGSIAGTAKTSSTVHVYDEDEDRDDEDDWHEGSGRGEGYGYQRN